MFKYDLHIKNGEVIDGTGAPKFKADIVVDKGKIIGVFNPDNNYSKLVMDKHKVKMINKEYGILNFDNKKGRYKIM